MEVKPREHDLARQSRWEVREHARECHEKLRLGAHVEPTLRLCQASGGQVRYVQHRWHRHIASRRQGRRECLQGRKAS